MKDFVFVSDFDGTLTDKDFYRIIMDDYLKDKCEAFYQDWRDKKIKDIDYLSYVFNNIDRNEEEIFEDILRITLDDSAKTFIGEIKAMGGDFIIVSAGTSYYIDMVLKRHNIEGIEVYSNKGIYKDRGIHFMLDKNSEFYSDIYGIDKELVVKKLKGNYRKVFYAGDSGPDLKPALIADVVFAKGQLIDMLRKENKDFIEFKSFSEILKRVKDYLKE